MTTTVFVNGVTLTDAPWFNDVDQITYDSDGASFVDFTQTGIGSTGAVARAVSDLFLDRVSLMNCLTVAQRAEVRAGTKLADYRALVQAYLDGIVAQARKTVVVVEPGTVWRLDSGITINASLIQLDAMGATFSFAQQTSGSAISITKTDLAVSLGGLRIEGNSSTGSVKAINITGTIADNVAVVKVSDFLVSTFGTGIFCGDYAYILSFSHFDIQLCSVSFDSAATVGGGSRLVLEDFLITSVGVTGAIGIRNTNINADIYCFGGAIECDVLVNQSGGRIHLYGTHLEANDWPSTPILLAGGASGTGQFAMFGGEVLSNQSTITANNFISIDNAVTVGSGGADFHGVYFQFGTTTTGIFAGGVRADQCRIFNPRGTYAFSIYSSGGIAYNGSEAVGTWTPALAGNSTAGTQTYTSRAGEWYRRGNTITVSFHLNMSAKDAATAGSIIITGLPFTSKNVDTRPGLAIGLWANITLTGYIQLLGQVNQNTTNLTLFKAKADGTLDNVVAADVTATTRLSATATYQLA